MRPSAPPTLGERFGRLVVASVDVDRSADGRHILWLCRCDCGTERLFQAGNVRRGGARSCGCARVGLGSKGPDHRHAYMRWYGMLGRCYSPTRPKYQSYGGRGIDVCGGWRESFESYWLDTGNRPTPDSTIDRENNDRGYHCGHCADCLALGRTKNWRWATPLQQGRNTRQNIQLTIGSETMRVCEWAERHGLPVRTLRKRLWAGWDPLRALTSPVNHQFSHARKAA